MREGADWIIYEVVEGGEMIVTHVSHPAGIILPGKPASKQNGKIHRYVRYICVNILESWGKKCRRSKFYQLR